MNRQFIKAVVGTGYLMGSGAIVLSSGVDWHQSVVIPWYESTPNLWTSFVALLHITWVVITGIGLLAVPFVIFRTQMNS